MTTSPWQSIAREAVKELRHLLDLHAYVLPPATVRRMREIVERYEAEQRK